MIDRKDLYNRAGDCKDMISEHKEQTEEDYQIYSVLCGVQLLTQPVPAEIEGGAATWSFVCGECRGQIDKQDRFCRHCGAEIDWKG